jgi:hypothetical protein
MRETNLIVCSQNELTGDQLLCAAGGTQTYKKSKERLVSGFEDTKTHPKMPNLLLHKIIICL